MPTTMPRISSRPRRTVALLASGAVLAAGAGAIVLPMGADAAPRTARVSLENYKFTPGKVTIARGGSVTWTWRDDAKHDVTSIGSKRFRSSKIKEVGTYRVTFKKPGTYHYLCSIHASLMKGTVVVK